MNEIYVSSSDLDCILEKENSKEENKDYLLLKATTRSGPLDEIKHVALVGRVDEEILENDFEYTAGRTQDSRWGVSEEPWREDDERLYLHFGSLKTKVDEILEEDNREEIESNVASALESPQVRKRSRQLYEGYIQQTPGLRNIS